MIGVVDTSALIRLFIPDGPLPEGFEEFLRGVERGVNLAIAPELLLVEASNVINRKRKYGELTKGESNQLLSDILSAPIRYFAHRPIISRAFELAEIHELTVYDTLYLALADDRGATVFSADHRLLKTATNMKLR